MKSIIRPEGVTKKVIGIEANRQIEISVDKNFKILIVTLHRMGFGIKRLVKLLELYKDVMGEYKKYDSEGVFDVMLEQEFKEFGSTPEEFTSTHIPYKERQRRISQKRKPVSIVEAEQMRKKLVEMKKYTEAIASGDKYVEKG
jgi:hypothetical protein